MNQRVVASIRAAEAVATDADGFAGAGVLVGKQTTAAAVQADCVAAQCRYRSRATQGGSTGRVIHFVRRGDTIEREVQFADVGGGRCGGVVGIVAGIRASQRDAADAHGLADGCVLVRKSGCAVADCQHVTCYAVVSQGCGCTQQTVIHFVHACCADGQCTGDDVGRGRCGSVEGVVASIRASQRDAADVNGLAGADVLVEEGSTAVAGGEDVANDAVVVQTDGRSRAGVIHSVRTNRGDGQAARGDIGGYTGRLNQVVIACIRAADAVAADTDGFAGAGVLVRKQTATAAAQADCIAAQCQYRSRAAQCGGSGGVIHFIRRSDAADRETQLGDVGLHTGRLYQDVVAGIRAADAVAADTDGFAGADVLVRKQTTAAAAQTDYIRAQGSDCRSAQGSGGGRVIHFVRCCYSDGKVGRSDRQLPTHERDVIALLVGPKVCRIDTDIVLGDGTIGIRHAEQVN